MPKDRDLTCLGQGKPSGKGAQGGGDQCSPLPLLPARDGSGRGDVLRTVGGQATAQRGRDQGASRRGRWGFNFVERNPH